jgi:hypothetical protein
MRRCSLELLTQFRELDQQAFRVVLLIEQRLIVNKIIQIFIRTVLARQTYNKESRIVFIYCSVIVLILFRKVSKSFHIKSPESLRGPNLN